MAKKARSNKRIIIILLVVTAILAAVHSALMLTTSTSRTFNDNSLAGMKFTYNPKQWLVIESPDGKGWRLENKLEDASLSITYEFPEFSATDATSISPVFSLDPLTNGIVRVGLVRYNYLTGNRYAYLPEGEVIVYKKNQEKYNQRLKECNNHSYLTVSEYRFERFESDECAKLIDGAIMGEVDTTFLVTGNLARVAPMKHFYPDWQNPDFNTETGHFSKVNVILSYHGDYPNTADKLVEQLHFLE